MTKSKILPALKACSLLAITGLLAAFAPIPSISWGTSSSLPRTDAHVDNESSAVGTKDMTPDRDVLQKIRMSIQKDSSLSDYARHIQITADDGTVTLAGPVRSQSESKNIESKAMDVVGVDNVVNDLSIRNSSTH